MVSALCGFTGSRHLSAASAPAVAALVASAQASGLAVVVGCARGADALVRSACPSARVLRAASQSPAALVARSVSLARLLAASPGSRLVALPASPCSPSVRPSSSPSGCFVGAGSGTWATAALAAGLGVQVFVFAPVALLPAFWSGSWSQVSPGLWQFVPAVCAVQAALF